MASVSLEGVTVKELWEYSNSVQLSLAGALNTALLYKKYIAFFYWCSLYRNYDLTMSSIFVKFVFAVNVYFVIEGNMTVGGYLP